MSVNRLVFKPINILYSFDKGEQRQLA